MARTSRCRQPTGFPRAEPLPSAHADRAVRQAGAREIDIVITRPHVLTGNWQALYDEVRASASLRRRPQPKTISTGELGTLENVARRVVHDGRCDFIKTSTGKKVNATLEAGVVWPAPSASTASGPGCRFPP